MLTRYPYSATIPMWRPTVYCRAFIFFRGRRTVKRTAAHRAHKYVVVWRWTLQLPCGVCEFIPISERLEVLSLFVAMWRKWLHWCWYWWIEISKSSAGTDDLLIGVFCWLVGWYVGNSLGFHTFIICDNGISVKCLHYNNDSAHWFANPESWMMAYKITFVN